MLFLRSCYWLRFISWLLVGMLLSGLWLIAPRWPQQTVHAAIPTAYEEGRAAYEREDYPVAIARWQSLLAQTHNPAEQATILNNLSLAYQALGDWETAKTTVETSLTLQGYDLQTRQPSGDIREPLRLAQSLDTYGQWYYLTGDIETAIALWEQAETYYIPTQNTQFQYWFENQINQARALQYLGYHLNAQQLLLALHSTLTDTASLSPDTRVDLAITLGRTLRLVGQLEPTDDDPISSLIVLKNAVQWESQVSQDLRSALHLELGNTQRVRAGQARRLRGTPPISGLAQEEAATKTVEFLERAALEEYHQATNLAPTMLQRVQAQLNELSLRIEVDSEAPEVADLVSTLPTALDSLPHDRPSLRARLSLVYQATNLAQQHPSLAPSQTELIEFLVIVINQSRELDDPHLLGEAWGSLGHLYEVLGQTPSDLEDALTATNQALKDTANAQQPALAYRLYWQLGRILKKQDKVQAAIAAYKASVQTIQSLRRDLVILNPDVQFSFRDDIEPVYRELADLLLKEEAPSQENLKAARETIDTLQTLEVENYLRQSCSNDQLEEIDKVVDELDPHAAFLYTIVLRDRLEIIAKFANSGNLVHGRVRQPDEAIFTGIRYFQTNVQEQSKAKLQEIHTSGEQVYQWLVQPIETELEGSDIETLVFVLDSELRNTAVQATRVNNRYLIEEYAITITPSLQLLGPRRPNINPLEALIIGVEMPPPGTLVQPLPFVGQEVQQIARLASNSKVLKDGEFTLTQLRQKIVEQRFPVIHIATHGEFSSQPEKTYLLAGDGYRITASELGNALKNRDEARSEPIDLLFLSACRTAVGDRRAALGLSGVAIQSGARSTISSLWYTEDRESAQLVIRFYDYWSQATNLGKAGALQQAQVDMIREEKMPVDWAQFSLVGNWL